MRTRFFKTRIEFVIFRACVLLIVAFQLPSCSCDEGCDLSCTGSLILNAEKCTCGCPSGTVMSGTNCLPGVEFDYLGINTVTDFTAPIWFNIFSNAATSDIYYEEQSEYYTSPALSGSSCTWHAYTDSDTGDVEIAERVTQVLDDHHYSVYLMGSNAQNNIEIFQTHDTYSSPPSGKSLYRIINLSPTSPLMNFNLYDALNDVSIWEYDRDYEGNIDLPSTDPLYEFHEIDSGDYQMIVSQASNGNVEHNSTISFPDQGAITIYLYGFIGGNWPYHLHNGVVWH